MVVILGCSHATCDTAPCWISSALYVLRESTKLTDKHNDRKEDTGACLGENEIRWHFKEDVCHLDTGQYAFADV